MRILVTGYKGFIGSYLIKRLRALNYNVYTFDREQIIEDVIRDINPEVIFHLAGNPLIKTSDVKGLIQDNTILTHRIVNTMKDNTRIIFSSSGVVYGDSPAKEVEFFENSPTLPTSIYGYTKLASENLIQAHTISGRIQSTIFRLIANVGKGATHGVVKDLVAKYHNNSTLEVLGEYPGSYKPYLYIDDTINALIMGMEKPLNGVYNLAPSNQLYISDIVDLILQRFGPKKVVWLGEQANWKGDNKIVSINTDKLRLAGWKPMYTSEGAVNATIAG